MPRWREDNNWKFSGMAVAAGRKSGNRGNVPCARFREGWRQTPPFFVCDGKRVFAALSGLLFSEHRSVSRRPFFLFFVNVGSAAASRCWTERFRRQLLRRRFACGAGRRPVSGGPACSVFCLRMASGNVWAAGEEKCGNRKTGEEPRSLPCACML